MYCLIKLSGKYSDGKSTRVDFSQVGKLEGKSVNILKRGNRVVVWDGGHYDSEYYKLTKKHSGSKAISLSVFLFGKPPEGLEWDHINRDPLDNRRENLRLATRRQNTVNTQKPKITSRGTVPTSQYKGVSLASDSSKRSKPWVATISIDWRNNKKKFLGYFKTEEEAHEAYIQAARELHGEFATT